MENYVPTIIEHPKLAEGQSAWGDIPTILKDIITRFNLKQNIALEFGVEYGYSTSALSNYFNNVIGVDTFEGDIHSGMKSNHLDLTTEKLKEFTNITLIKSDYKNYINNQSEIFDLIHIDIIHTYEPTFECGEWAVQHSKCVIFHDTESFPEMKKVVQDLATKYNLDCYNYDKSNGLGILINHSLYIE